MKTVIVSGSNGFIGSAVIRELIKHDIDVIGLYHHGNRGNFVNSNRVLYLPMELAEINKLESTLINSNCDLFYNFAWTGTSGNGRADPLLQLQNAKWTIDCLNLANRIGCKRFINAGSIMEIETLHAIYAKGNKPGLSYLYGSGKIAAHAMCKSIAANIGIDLIWTMITNAYGVGEISPRFINSTLRNIINGKPLTFTSGTQNYDFIYIDDVARAFFLIGEKGKPFFDYLIGSGNPRQLKEFIIELRDTVAPGQELLFGEIPFTGINLPLETFDCSQTENDTGFKAEINFRDGIRKTMEWIKSSGAYML